MRTIYNPDRLRVELLSDNKILAYVFDDDLRKLCADPEKVERFSLVLRSFAYLTSNAPVLLTNEWFVNLYIETAGSILRIPEAEAAFLLKGESDYSLSQEDIMEKDFFEREHDKEDEYGSVYCEPDDSFFREE